MPFTTQISYNRQLSQSSGTSEFAMFSGSTKIGQRLWTGLPDYSLEYGDGDYSYTGNSGYTFVVQEANYLGVVTGANATNIYDDGRLNTYGVSITAYSGLTSGNTVLSIAQSPLHPVDLNSATISLTASSLQIAYDTLISSSSQDLGIDASGNIVKDTSSKRFKKDIQDIKFTNLDKLLELKPKKFKWKSNSSEDWGYIAEEVEALGLKEFVNYTGGKIESVKNDIDYVLDSNKSHKYVVKSLATCNIFPDNGLIDTQWESLEMLPESCVEFRYYKRLSCWMIVSSDGIKES